MLGGDTAKQFDFGDTGGNVNTLSDNGDLTIAGFLLLDGEFFFLVLGNVFTLSGSVAYRSLRIAATSSMNIFVIGSMALQLSATILGISLNDATVILMALAV